jgi:photosystem II stability/assembly factor-like uncharacterized protein
MFGVRTVTFALWLALVPAVLANTRSPCSIQRAAATESHVWLLCDRSDLFVSADAGATWQTRRLPAEGKFRAMAFLDARRGLIVGNAGTVMATDDAAETWKRIDVGTEENLTAIHFTGEHGWITGWNGVILHSKDRGRTWERQNSGVLQALDDVYFVDSENGWAVGWVGTALRTTDGGQTWERLRVPNTLWSFNAVHFSDRSRGWIVGFGGLILSTKDGGQTWESQSAPLQASLKSVGFDRIGKGWIAADTHLLTTADGGETWKPVELEGTLFLRQVLMVKNSLWAIGQFGVLRQNGGADGFAALATLPAPAPGRS